MVFHYRYSNTYGFLMMLIAKSKTVNGFSLSIFINLRFFMVFNSKKQNGQWFFISDIQKLIIFVMFSTAKSKTVNGLSLSIFKNLRFFNVLNSNSFSLPVIVVILMYLSLGTRASCIYLWSHFLGPGLETWLPPDSSRRQRRFLRCSSFRGLCSSSRRLPS